MTYFNLQETGTTVTGTERLVVGSALRSRRQTFTRSSKSIHSRLTRVRPLQGQLAEPTQPFFAHRPVGEAMSAALPHRITSLAHAETLRQAMSMMRTNTVKTPEQQRIAEEMRRAISAYTGPVTKCPPGEASAAAAKQPTEAGKYLKAHADDAPDAAAEARRHRTTRMKRDHIAKRNAPIKRRMEKQERKTIRNMAIIKR